MTINWRLRDPVFRLLAAVYAELDEEGLKGRYGRIAKFYGPEATYDAIKSFFAKEIARAAQGLKAQNPQLRGGGSAFPQRQLQRPRRGPLHLDFNDDDISILHEQVVQAGFTQALQRPAKRRRVSRARVFAEPRASNVALADSTTGGARTNGYSVAEQIQTQSGVTEVSTQDVAPEVEMTSSSENSLFQCSQPSQPTDQPSESSLHNLFNVGSVLSTNFNTTTNPQLESYGYVTNDGKFRCALCRNQLVSEEALQKHERISDLHLQNLKNLFMVSKAQAKMAQVTHVPSPQEHRQHSPVSSRPLRLGGFERQEQPDAAVVPSSSRIPTSPEGTVNENHNDERRHEDFPLGMIEVRGFSPGVAHAQDSNQRVPSAQSTAPSGGDLRQDKGKGRASPARVDAPAPEETCPDPQPRNPNPQRTYQRTYQPLEEETPAEVEPKRAFTHAQNVPGANNTPAPLPRARANNTTKVFANPINLAEVLRSTGMQLADLQRGLAAAAAGIEKGDNGFGENETSQKGYMDGDRDKFRRVILID